MKNLYTLEPDEGCREFDGVYGRPVHNDEMKALKAKGWKENADELRNQEKREEKETQEQVSDVESEDSLEAQYERVLGKKPHHKMKPETMAAHIAEASSDD